MEDKMQAIVSLSKRRGFIYQGSEIYGGIGGFYDYGPMGVELKNNIKKLWWKEMVQTRDDVVGLDSAIITHPRVWEASGHVEAFTDPLVECWNCHKRLRSDKLPNISEGNKLLVAYRSPHLAKKYRDKLGNEVVISKSDDYLDNADNECTYCGAPINTAIDTPRQFNLLMKTYLGAVEDAKSETYLRGETCQGIYLNYKNIKDTIWVKIPFGIAQIGKAFRNEITPGNFTFRMREFEQMELQFFIKNSSKVAQDWFEYWKQERMKWYEVLGINKDNLRFRDHADDERAHYAKAATDIEYQFPFGWDEFEGIHNRSDWDLSRHSQYSGQDLSYFDEETKERYIPWIIETSVGADRLTLVALIDAYHEEEQEGKKRVVMKFDPKLAPIKVAVFPLMANKEELVTEAKKIHNELKIEFPTMYDGIGNVGKRYRRQDEIGTPWCVTVDYESLDKRTVTVRDRDTMEQERVAIQELEEFFKEKLK